MRGTPGLLNVIFRARDICTESRFINRNLFPWTKKICVFTNTKALIRPRPASPPLSVFSSFTALSAINLLAWMAEYNTPDLLGTYKCSSNGGTITTFGKGCHRECGAAGKRLDGMQRAATLRVACPLADWMGTCKEIHQTQCRYKHQCVCVCVCIYPMKALSQQHNCNNHQWDTGRLLI